MFLTLFSNQNYIFIFSFYVVVLYLKLPSARQQGKDKVSYFHGEKFSRDFVFTKKGKFVKFAKFLPAKYSKKSAIREIRENLFQNVPRNSRKFTKKLALVQDLIGNKKKSTEKKVGNKNTKPKFSHFLPTIFFRFNHFYRLNFICMKYA